MANKWPMIVLDGLDGSGKTAQSKLLQEFFLNQNKAVFTFDFPSYHTTVFGKLCGRYLAGEFGPLEKIDPYAAAFLYAGDRLERVEELREAVNEFEGNPNGRVVLLNRYVSSNIAYQAARYTAHYDAHEIAKWIRQLEYEVNGLPEPDLTVFFDLPVDIAQGFVAKKDKESRSYLDDNVANGENKLDIHERDTSFLNRVRNEYLHTGIDRTDFEGIRICYPTGEVMSISEVFCELLAVLYKHNLITGKMLREGVKNA